MIQTNTKEINPKIFGRVAVLYGGNSSEREVSLLSGKEVIEALKSAGIETVAIDVNDTKNLYKQLVDSKCDRVFLILHGGLGEDGSIAGMLDCMQIPYTGSKVLGSAVAMNKEITKRILLQANVPTLKYICSTDFYELENFILKNEFPFCIKPSKEGSSIGVHKIRNYKEFVAAYDDAKQYGELILEPWVEGYEFSVSILNEKPLCSVKIGARETFYDYKAKYFSNETVYEFDTLDSEKEKELQQIAIKAFKAVSCNSWGRVDIMQSKKTGEFNVLEINTIPGFTRHSIVPKAAKKMGIEYKDLVIAILMDTLPNNHKDDLKLVNTPSLTESLGNV